MYNNSEIANKDYQFLPMLETGYAIPSEQYDYLLSMDFWSLTAENSEELKMQ